MGGLDWRALLSQPATASVVVKKSPFDVKKRDAGVGTGQGDTTPASSTAADAQQADTTRQESVVPIVLLKAAMRQHPAERFHRSKVSEDPLRKLRELQQLISDSLAAAAEVAKQGEHKEQQQQQDRQQRQQGPDMDDPYLRRPVPPPQHATDQDDCYFWSGSRTSQYSGTTAAAAGTAGAWADHDGVASSSTQHQAAGSSSRVPGNTAAQSMDTSATTRVPASQGSTEVFSTARSPAEKWGSALLRLRQLQLETVEALDVQE